MITQAVTHAFLLDSFNGLHQPGDDYRMALYQSIAVLDATTSEYTVDGESAGPGYTPGGTALMGRSVLISAGIGILTFDDAVWPVATVTARGAMIYNATRSNRAIAILTLRDSDGNEIDVSSTNGEFRVTLPPPTATDALIRMRFNG